MVQAARQTINETDATVNLEMVDEVEKAILEVQTALATGDNTEIKSMTEALKDGLRYYTNK